MPQGAPLELDKRVLKEDYCNYDLIARCWNDEYRGVIWKNKERIADYDGMDLDEIMAELRDVVDEMQAEKRKARGRSKPGAEELAEAIRSIEPKLTRPQKMMLILHNKSPTKKVSIKGLSRVGEYTDEEAAFRDYAVVAQRLSDELAYAPRPRKKNAHPTASILFEEEIIEGKVDAETTVTLRPEIVEALTLLQW